MAQLKEKKSYRVVVGLGQSGLSCIRYLHEQGYVVCGVDSRENPPAAKTVKELDPPVTMYLGGFPEDIILSAQEIIVSPGVSIHQQPFLKAQELGIPLIGDIELFCRAVQAPIVAITGSNGKSTVTDLLGTMASHCNVNAAVGGNIGIPALELIERSDVDVFILELSSFQLETTHSLRAKVATVLNISQDHMDRYTGIEQYQQAKHRIYSGAEQALFNRQDTLTIPTKTVGQKQFSFGLDEAKKNEFGLVSGHDEMYLAQGAERLLAVSDLKIKGSHNQANALSALALGTAAGFGQAGMLQALREYPGLRHRCEWLGQSNNVDWINDSKGTNVGAAVAALSGFYQVNGFLVLIAGGVGKGADFEALGIAVDKYVDLVILFGEDKSVIHSTLKAQQSEAGSLNCIEVDSLEAAVTAAQRATDSIGDLKGTVLFSPACASFDMFANFEHRGDCFRDVVQTKVFNLNC